MSGTAEIGENHYTSSCYKLKNIIYLENSRTFNNVFLIFCYLFKFGLFINVIKDFMKMNLICCIFLGLQMYKLYMVYKNKFEPSILIILLSTNQLKQPSCVIKFETYGVIVILIYIEVGFLITISYSFELFALIFFMVCSM